MERVQNTSISFYCSEAAFVFVFGGGGYGALNEADLMKAAKEMEVKIRNRLVMQLQLKKILQGPDQPVQTYLASLKSVSFK